MLNHLIAPGNMSFLPVICYQDRYDEMCPYPYGVINISDFHWHLVSLHVDENALWKTQLLKRKILFKHICRQSVGRVRVNAQII